MDDISRCNQGLSRLQRGEGERRHGAHRIITDSERRHGAEILRRGERKYQKTLDAGSIAGIAGIHTRENTKKKKKKKKKEPHRPPSTQKPTMKNTLASLCALLALASASAGDGPPCLTPEEQQAMAKGLSGDMSSELSSKCSSQEDLAKMGLDYDL